MPLLFVWNLAGPNEGSLLRWTIRLQQQIATKFLITKILSRQLPVEVTEEGSWQNGILFG